MATWSRFLFVGVVLAGLPVVGSADTVVLTNGARISGEIGLCRDGVTVQSPNGVLTLPSWRIVQVLRGSEASAAQPVPEETAPVASPEGPAPARASQAAVEPSPRRAAPPRVADLLARTASVSFDGASVYEALQYIREMTGVNMGITAEARTAQPPVYLTVTDVPLRTILQEILEPANLDYTVRPGEILYIGRRGTLKSVVRVYPVTDLLLSIEDLPARGNGTNGSGASTTSVSPQYAGQGLGTQLVANGAGNRNGNSGAFSPLSTRAENLALLIKSTCHPDTWADAFSSGLIDAAGGRMPAVGQGGIVLTAP